MQNFICPCCDYRGEWSEDLANKIVQSVCDYYGVDVKEMFLLRKSEKANRAFVMSIYFMRMMTGELFKVIAGYFGYTHSVGAKRFANIRTRIELSVRYQQEANKVKLTITEKLNPHKQLKTA